VVLFAKHNKNLNLKEIIPKNTVVLVRNALRKISNNVDIYAQVNYSPDNVLLIGRVDKPINEFSAGITLIRKIPTDSLVRNISKIAALIRDINYVKLQYKCDVCKAEIDNTHLCRRGCYIKNPILVITVLALVQDGTGKAVVELKDDKAVKALDISESDL